MQRHIRTRFIRPCLVLVLLAALAGCKPSTPASPTEKQLVGSSNAVDTLVMLPPALASTREA